MSDKQDAGLYETLTADAARGHAYPTNDLVLRKAWPETDRLLGTIFQSKERGDYEQGVRDFQKINQDSSVKLEQPSKAGNALMKLGFPSDHFMPIDAALTWTCRIFPKENTPESWKAWEDEVRQCLSLSVACNLALNIAKYTAELKLGKKIRKRLLGKEKKRQSRKSKDPLANPVQRKLSLE